MSANRINRPLALALGTAMATSLAGTGSAAASENPFAMQPLSAGHLMLAEGGGQKGMEGKCGIQQMDADGDGKVTREEFIQGHEAMFSVIDANGDGVIDPAEQNAHMRKREQRMAGEHGE